MTPIKNGHLEQCTEKKTNLGKAASTSPSAPKYQIYNPEESHIGPQQAVDYKSTAAITESIKENNPEIFSTVNEINIDHPLPIPNRKPRPPIPLPLRLRPPMPLPKSETRPMPEQRSPYPFEHIDPNFNAELIFNTENKFEANDEIVTRRRQIVIRRQIGTQPQHIRLNFPKKPNASPPQIQGRDRTVRRDYRDPSVRRGPPTDQTNPTPFRQRKLQDNNS